MVKLADTPDLGSGERSCRFEPCQAHHKVKETAFFKTVSFFIFAVIGRNHCTNNRVLAEIPSALMSAPLSPLGLVPVTKEEWASASPSALVSELIQVHWLGSKPE